MLTRVRVTPLGAVHAEG